MTITATRANVTCERCGHVQTMQRQFTGPETFYAVCHACESSLQVEVTAEQLRKAHTTTRRTDPPAMPAPVRRLLVLFLQGR